VALERRNLRRLSREDVPEPLDLITLDLSFISLTLVLPRMLEFLRAGGEIVALVKPSSKWARARWVKAEWCGSRSGNRRRWPRWRPRPPLWAFR
ncbi:MAG: hypothetical protein ACLP7A_07300, partial [Desulfobaccales bacterium]